MEEKSFINFVEVRDEDELQNAFVQFSVKKWTG